MMILRTFGALLVAAAVAAAQQGAMEDAVRKQAAEISRLMRESEKLLLELTRVDKLVQTQKQVEDELKKLIPPEQGSSGAAGAEADAQRAKLEQQQKEVRRQLEEMLSGEKAASDLAAQQIEELLKNLPRDQQQQQGGGEESKEEREKRMKERQEEQKQHQEQPQAGQQPKPRDEKDQQKRSDKRPKDQDPAASRIKRIEAWIARLPPEDQERINRNDFSRIPARYRRLVEEYTAQRAKRDAEAKSDSDR